MVSVFIVLFVAPLVYAQDIFDPCDATIKDNLVCGNTGEENIFLGQSSLLGKATQIVVLATGSISVLMVVIGGLRFTLSSGDPQKTTAARQQIIYAVVGVAIAVFAQTILTFVIGRI